MAAWPAMIGGEGRRRKSFSCGTLTKNITGLCPEDKQ